MSANARRLLARAKDKEPMLRRDLDGLFRDTTLTTLAFAIAFGWSLFQVASGLGSLITTAVHGFDTGGDSFGVVGALVWKVGDHFVVFDQLVQGLIAFGGVLTFLLLVPRSVRRV
jgi:hypothetical protein